LSLCFGIRSIVLGVEVDFVFWVLAAWRCRGGNVFAFTVSEGVVVV